LNSSNKDYKFRIYTLRIKLKFMKAIKTSMLVLALGLMSFSANITSKDPIIEETSALALAWKSDNVEVGKIPQGTPKLIQFEFKNNSNKEVIITNVKPACGCTAADYTKTAIQPGKIGYVKATYNAVAPGNFTKTVTVTTSADANPKVLTFKGTVIAKA
jgi:hypothetical protein